MTADNLRLLIQSQCQYDCFYCPLKAGISSLEDMKYSTLMRLCRTLAESGIKNVEITGGEPLLYEDIDGLVRDLKKDIGISQVYMTTNGLLLADKAKTLQEAGLDGVNIHLDTVMSDAFTHSTGREQLLNEVLKGIWKAVALDIPTTISVVLHEYSVDECGVMAGLAKKMPVTVRFTTAGSCSSEIPRETVLQKLLVSAGGNVEKEGEYYLPEGWNGRITFGSGIAGAFGMEQALLLGGSIVNGRED